MQRSAIPLIGIGTFLYVNLAFSAPPGAASVPEVYPVQIPPQDAPRLSPSTAAGAASSPSWRRVRYGNPNALYLRSEVGLVIDEREGVILYAREIDEPRPIASLTKLLTVMTLLDANLSLDEPIRITKKDRDRLKNSRSRLRFGTTLSRRDLMRVALVASDNRAAAALARTYPGGKAAMIEAMNEEARSLGLDRTRMTDASGLHRGNVSTARDLARLAYVARRYPLIERWSTIRRLQVTDLASGAVLTFRNTNALVHRDAWDIALSKTGYTSEAGNCLVMRSTIAERPLIVVLLNSWGKLSKYGDSGRIRDWLLATDRAREDQADREAPIRDVAGLAGLAPSHGSN